MWDGDRRFGECLFSNLLTSYHASAGLMVCPGGQRFRCGESKLNQGVPQWCITWGHQIVRVTWICQWPPCLGQILLEQYHKWSTPKTIHPSRDIQISGHIQHTTRCCSLSKLWHVCSCPVDQNMILSSPDCREDVDTLPTIWVKAVFWGCIIHWVGNIDFITENESWIKI